MSSPTGDAPSSPQPPKELPMAEFVLPKASGINKRKYEDALTLLDDAAGTRPVVSSSVERLPPPKRARTSLYSTLAKYGIGTSVDHSKNSSLSNLQRVIQRAKSVASGSGTITDASSHVNEKLATYDPDSREEFLKRLQTFKLITYSPKPTEIDAVAAARCGWFNEGGKESLTCKSCKVVWTMPSLHNVSKDQLSETITKHQAMLVDQHKLSCPWRVRQAEPSIYSMEIPAPAALSATVLQHASELQTAASQISVKHPLTSHQVSLLLSAVNSAQADLMRKAVSAESSSLSMSQMPEESAIIVAFFGWSLFSPVSRSTNVSATATPSGLSTPGSGSGRAMVMCKLCARQVGLWSFASGTLPQSPSPNGGPPAAARSSVTRQFDVLKEHRPHCPYIVKTTYLPLMTLPGVRSQSQDLLEPLPFVEGWKALMSVVSRSQWRKSSASVLRPTASSAIPISPKSGLEGLDADQSGESQVDDILKDVKSRHGGGRDLVRFVKGLLG